MRNCRKCGKPFKFYARINGEVKNLGNRYFCLECSPWGHHNTRDITKPKAGPYVRQRKTACTKCKRKCPEVSFYKGQSQCKGCINEAKLRRDIAFKEKAIAYKGGECQQCGYAGHYAAFDFHHVRDKEMVWGMMRNVGWEKAKTELDKCELLCSNCHRILHSGHKKL